ncbi:MAG: cell division protein FtsA [Acidobacteria bacterium]|nr:cell division protein FtsA [Acidobacteriota bacterium]MBS1865708.1 cell division protein FtsA [Acidobacteriota bacterium]
MSKKDKYIVGLDIGSTKTCVLIAEVVEESVKFLALGAAESKGLRKGLIVNLDSTVSSIRRAVEEAESVCGVPVESALIGVAGSHVRGLNSRGGITLGNRPRDIEREDVKRAVDAARGVNLPEDREILHVLPHEFIVDAHDGIRDPIGMVGQHLEANVQLVTSSIIATQNLVTAANRAGILISDTVLEPLASSDACLTQDERDLGCCLLDIGGGTTEIIVYGGGAIRHTSAVAIGGDHFTNDLAVGLRTPIPEAERIKRHHGCAASALLREDASIEIASVGDRPPRTIFARSLTEIIEPRAQELVALIRDDLQRAGLLKQMPAGFIFAGGGARLNGLDEMTEQLFHLPVRVAEPKGILDLPEQVAQPEYSTAVGLVLYGAKARRNAPARSGGIVGKLKAMFAGA